MQATSGQLLIWVATKSLTQPLGSGGIKQSEEGAWGGERADRAATQTRLMNEEESLKFCSDVIQMCSKTSSYISPNLKHNITIWRNNLKHISFIVLSLWLFVDTLRRYCRWLLSDCQIIHPSFICFLFSRLRAGCKYNEQNSQWIKSVYRE